jgi:hypothetical protein
LTSDIDKEKAADRFAGAFLAPAPIVKASLGARRRSLEIYGGVYIHIRTALNLCKKWVDSDFITQHGSANKSRKYELSDKWLELV